MPWTAFAWSTAAVALAALVGRLIVAVAPLPNISMIFLMAVLFAAVSFGIWPAILTSLLSFLAYNFLFIEPLYSFTVAEPSELLALIVFLIVAVVTSTLAGRLRQQIQARAVAQSEAETERIRNILLASVSHDFRTPLASILGAATSLLDYRHKLDQPAQDDLLRQIRDESEGLDGLVRNLLAMTRIDADALELRRDWLDLREALERAVSLLRRRRAGISIEMRLPDDLPLIRADAALIEQALGNVLNNSVDHTPPGTRIIVAAQAGAGAITLTVTDDGPGIPAQLLPRIFEKFARGDGPGTGLGLAIAKGIMSAHGGTIAAESPVAGGRGTRIALTFPREQTP